MARWVCPRRGGAHARRQRDDPRRRWAAARAGARGRRRRVRGGARLLRRDAVQKHGAPQGRVLVRHDRRRRRIAGRGRVRAGPRGGRPAAARTRLAGDARASPFATTTSRAASPPTSASTRRGRTTPSSRSSRRPSRRATPRPPRWPSTTGGAHCCRPRGARGTTATCA